MEESDLLPLKFLKSLPSFKELPLDGQLEVALMGRSNVGKSSILNAIAGSNKLARTSKTPGCTKLFNFYQVATGGYLVDLPGFGYAKASKALRAQWHEETMRYLKHRKSLVGIFLIVDCRRGLQEIEKELIQLCTSQQLKILVLLNKTDKLNQSGLAGCLRSVRADAALTGSIEICPLSVYKGTGLKEVQKVLQAWFGRLDDQKSVGFNPVTSDADINRQG